MNGETTTDTGADQPVVKKTAKKKPPTKTQQRTALWSSLNGRQQTYLLVIYQADQDAEDLARGAWARGGQTESAEVWRWLDYGITSSPIPGANGQGLLQRRLTEAQVRDQGAGSTLTVLRHHGLIKQRYFHTLLGSTILQVRLTTEGRAVARAGGADGASPARRRRPEQLSEGHWSMVAEVAAAGPDGHATRSISGAWDRLIERGLIGHDWGTFPARYRLTAAGRDHYELGWLTYALMYPTVNAVRPDGTPFWPRAVDRRLRVLDEVCRTLAAALSGAEAEAAAVLPAREHLPAEGTPGWSPEISRAVALQHERVDAADQMRGVAAGQIPELTELYGRAAHRFLVTAAAVVTAVTSAEGDPVAALEIPDLDVQEQLSELPAPVVGIPIVEKALDDERTRLLGPAVRGRSRTPAQPLRPEVMAAYARALMSWTSKGYLGRLMLRCPSL